MASELPSLVAVFDDRLEAQRALRDLEALGFTDHQIGFAIRGSDVAQGGMITDTEGTKDGRGAMVGAGSGALVGGLLGAAATLLIPGVGPVIAVGLLGAVLGGAVAGTAVGGIMGAMAGLNVSEEEAKYYEKCLTAGKAIIAVHPGSRTFEAEQVLRRHGAYDMHISAQSPIPTEGIFNRP